MFSGVVASFNGGGHGAAGLHELVDKGLALRDGQVGVAQAPEAAFDDEVAGVGGGGVAGREAHWLTLTRAGGPGRTQDSAAFRGAGMCCGRGPLSLKCTVLTSIGGTHEIS